MVSPLFFYQLVVFALLWLVVVLHLPRPKPGVSTPGTPAQPKPCRLSDSNRTILAAKELRHSTQTLMRHLINPRFDVKLY
jgi:hypothetical protein